MANLLSFMRVILCIAVTLDVGVSARNIARLQKLNHPSRQTSELIPHRDERNLGGLSLLNNLPKPDLSKYGLPPLPDLSEIFNLPKELASGGSATPNARNLGGLSQHLGLPKPDLSKLGLPPLPDLSEIFNLPKELASGSSATPNARNLGGLSGMPKPDLSKFGLPPLPDLPNLFDLVKQLGSGSLATPNARNLGGIPELPAPFDLPFGLFELPKVKLPFGIQKPDLADFLSTLYSKKIQHEDLKIMNKYREQQLEKQLSPAPAPATTAKTQPTASLPVNNGGQQQMPKQNPSSQQPMNQGMPSMNPGGQQQQSGGMQNHVMTNRPSNMPNNMAGQPMNQGMSNPMHPQGVPNRPVHMGGQPMNPGITHFMKYKMPNIPLNTPGQGPPPLRDGNERPDPMRRRLY